MTMRKHKLGLKHCSTTGKSRTLKERQIQRVKKIAKKYKLLLIQFYGN